MNKIKISTLVYRIVIFHCSMNEMCSLFIYFYHRSQNETLKKEILDQERGLKCQIATLEKKAHENWVSYSIILYLCYTVLCFTNLIFRNK